MNIMSEEVFFVLYCPSDDSHILVDEASVIFDDSVQVGDTVKVAFSNLKDLVEGVVKDYSKDYDKMNNLMKKLNSETKPKRDTSFHNDRPRQAALRCKKALPLNVTGRSSSKKDTKVIKEASSHPSARKTGKTDKSFVATTSKSNIKENPKVLPKRSTIYSSSSDTSDEAENHGSSITPIEHTDPGRSDCEAVDFDRPIDVNDSDSSDTEFTPEQIAVLKKLTRKKKIEDFRDLAKLVSEKKTDAKKNDIKSPDRDAVESKDESEKKTDAKKNDIKSPDRDAVESKDESALPLTSPNIAHKTAITSKPHGAQLVMKNKAVSQEMDFNGPCSSKGIDEKNGENQTASRQDHSATPESLDSLSHEESLLGDDQPTPPKVKKANNWKRKASIKRGCEKITFNGDHLLCKETDEKVVKLSPTHNIFVEEKGLKKVKASATSCTAIARPLLKLVFTREALKMCSVSGKPSFNSVLGVSEVRTPLDSEGIDAILDFVHSRAIKKNWPVPNPVFLKQAMANTLVEIRAAARLREETSSEN